MKNGRNTQHGHPGSSVGRVDARYTGGPDPGCDEETGVQPYTRRKTGSREDRPPGNAGDQGKPGAIYGAIGEKEVVDKVLKELKVELQKKNVKIKKPIKELGEHEVEIKITDDVSAKLKVVVEAEG